MKITLISFDYFGFDNHIVQELNKRGIESHHIDISKFNYRYKSKYERIKNSFSKLFFNTNIKQVKMEEFVCNELKSYGKQDKILVIRPDRIRKKTHLKIREFTKDYIAYIYDSSNRFPIKHLFNRIFDKIFTFDLDDSKKYNLEHISNYIYLPKQEIKKNFKTDFFMISSIDERLPMLNKIAKYCSENNVISQFVVVGKRKPFDLEDSIFFTNKNLFFEEIEEYINEAKVFVDLIRKNQNGLSFRIFEALAYQRKIITTNASIKKYDFYNENNILILNENNLYEIKDFVNTDFVPIDDAIYFKYTIVNWVNTVFKL